MPVPPHRLGASKLPQVGTTIFTVISALVQKHRAVNVGQGFPDFDCDPRLQQLVTEHGAAAIPIAGLYLEPYEARVVRLCFAKKDETLHRALERLVKV